METKHREKMSRVKSVYIQWCNVYQKEPSEARFRIFTSNFLTMEGITKERGVSMQMNKWYDCTEEEYRIAMETEQVQEDVIFEEENFTSASTHAQDHDLADPNIGTEDFEVGISLEDEAKIEAESKVAAEEHEIIAADTSEADLELDSVAELEVKEEESDPPKLPFSPTAKTEKVESELDPFAEFEEDHEQPKLPFSPTARKEEVGSELDPVTKSAVEEEESDSNSIKLKMLAPKEKHIEDEEGRKPCKLPFSPTAKTEVESELEPVTKSAVEEEEPDSDSIKLKILAPKDKHIEDAHDDDDLEDFLMHQIDGVMDFLPEETFEVDGVMDFLPEETFEAIHLSGPSETESSALAMSLDDAVSLDDYLSSYNFDVIHGGDEESNSSFEPSKSKRDVPHHAIEATSKPRRGRKKKRRNKIKKPAFISSKRKGGRLGTRDDNSLVLAADSNLVHRNSTTVELQYDEDEEDEDHYDSDSYPRP